MWVVLEDRKNLIDDWFGPSNVESRSPVLQIRLRINDHMMFKLSVWVVLERRINPPDVGPGPSEVESRSPLLPMRLNVHTIHCDWQ